MGKFIASFGYAWRGICAHFGSQTNPKVQLGVALLVVLAGFVVGIRQIEWCLVLLCIMVMFAVEALNSALESLADAVHPEKHPLVGKAKDMAAGAALICAMGSSVIGAIIFLPYFGLRL